MRTTKQLSSTIITTLFAAGVSSCASPSEHHGSVAQRVHGTVRARFELAATTTATSPFPSDRYTVEDGDQLTRFLHGTIDRIPGIHRTQYTLAHQFVKHDHRWTSLVD